ncbi:transcriptional regulator [Pusillimonas sp. DMV24BSW_D]|uniref:PhaM family polyhydroxyalkanoate granule multifunctional regulatory protein n=1 Tax=Neopusillimonas aestuarii TaxID=2716226 RepID=UPI00140BFDB3|nr:PhaM family polyhydroxyalkanoate granule multifunctional regulatory protein [Pusillimonas sp. DMV24BSW_D]QIM47959.1 transcriptional regulator [Pusillimonas sp. DMV24BSW_D]
MTQSNNSNPFMFPGLGQQGDLGHNPMLASIEMMRQAWDNLAQAGASHGLGLAAPPMNIEDLDRRIAELRTVENWLRMNLSMLTSTIQGLEVQRATISTLKSFVSPEGMTGNGDNPSALEVALGLKPSGQAKIKPAPAAEHESAGAEAMQQGTEAAQAWWSMLQNQFNTLASATSAGMATGDTFGKASGGAKKAAGASASSADAKSTMSAASAPKRTAAARARKPTGAAARQKTGAARKTAARKRSAAKKAAG